MADSYPPFTRPNSFLGKLLFFTFFLVAIPLFPSRAPDLVNQTLLNKFWELFHLMFIGIAVSYGLFGRRNIENVSHDDSDHSHVAGMFHFPSIFEDGFDDLMYYSGEGKADSFNVKNEEHVFQTWSSKYVHKESMVVLAQPHCGFDEKYDEWGSFIDHKSLGLPVRSLISTVGARVSPEFSYGSSDSSGPSADSSDGSEKSGSGRFSDLGSEEGKYDDRDVLGSPIPWRSRSRRTRQRVHSSVDGAASPSHFRPLLVDETRFQSLKSRSLHSQSHSLSSLSPSHSTSSASASASHSPQYSECNDSSSGKEWSSGYSLKFNAKRVVSSKASSRGKSHRMFGTFQSCSSTLRSRYAGEEENHIRAEAYKGGFNRQNLGCNSYIPNPTSPTNWNQEQRQRSENSDSETEDEETMMPGSLSVAGSDSCEVDRKAGEFIAKFREQIRLQRTTSIDTPKGLGIPANLLR